MVFSTYIDVYVTQGYINYRVCIGYYFPKLKLGVLSSKPARPVFSTYAQRLYLLRAFISSPGIIRFRKQESIETNDTFRSGMSHPTDTITKKFQFVSAMLGRISNRLKYALCTFRPTRRKNRESNLQECELTISTKPEGGEDAY